MTRRGFKKLSVAALALVFTLGLALTAAAGTNLRLQSHMPPDQAKRTIGEVVKIINEITGGQMKVKVFPVGGLVPTKQLLEAVGNGTVDMATAPEGYWHKLVPVSEIAQGLPFAFEDNVESVAFMYYRGFLPLLRKGYAKLNVHVIPYEPYNTGLMTKKPIMKASDLKGMKLRAFGTMQKWLSKMGASTVTIPGSELYTALSTGVVEGAHWGDAYPMFEMKLHEVLKNYMMPDPVIGSWNSLWINLDVWNKFTPQQQAQIEAAALSGGGFFCYNDTRFRCKLALKEMAEKWGVKINQLPPDQIVEMRKAASAAWAEMAQTKDPLLQEAFKLFYDFLAELGRPVK